MNVEGYLKVFAGVDFYIVASHCEQSIDAAVSKWVDSGKTCDTLMDLELAEGATLKLLASQVQGWIVTTKETRRAWLELTQALDEEQRRYKIELGIFE